MPSSHLESEDGSGNDTQVDCHSDDIPITDISEERPTLVKVISEEDLVAEKYTVDDIVLPLPGSRIIYPLNDFGQVYHDLAKKDEICLTESVHNSKEFSLTNMTGAYRRVFQKPKDFEWELINYTDINKPLAETDWDIIVKSNAATFVRDSNEKEQSNCKLKAGEFDNDTELSAGTGETKSHIEENIQIDESLGASTTQESQMALKLSFTLSASSYATMAIRELLKTSTSVAFHKALN
ncbi:tRNA pseudouridine(13) synthase [Handroanthus impetiginosus]|uniref:tRNA pseudouridine(13) synthase n=1 Tax=Handroanthus impetiginosus TaxID=429701 RepID=A0A2G9IA19_9LAMI|nr:tRNA pseudouridine(13) synthase [Handroanthus impetiginosus]